MTNFQHNCRKNIASCNHIIIIIMGLMHQSSSITLIGASVSEPPLSGVNGNFVRMCVQQMHGPIYRKYFKYLFQRHALAHARPTMLCIH